jgi:hypothetical protein
MGGMGCRIYQERQAQPRDAPFAHRKKRPRRPMVAMMLHQDASTHAWLPGDARIKPHVLQLSSRAVCPTGLEADIRNTRGT